MSYGPEECIKVIVVGNCGVGKTSLLHRFVRCNFIDRYTKTIGAEFLVKDVLCGEFKIPIKLMLWDTAGQEMSNALTQAYYCGAGAAILSFSTVDHDSFTDVAKWKQKVEFVCGPIVMVLCQTKCDLFHESSVTDSEAMGLAEEFQLPLFRVSSKDNFNVYQLFEFITQQYLRSEEFGESEGPSNQLKALDIRKRGVVSLFKESEDKVRLSSGYPADSALVVGKVTTNAAIATDECAASVSTAVFSSVKTPTPQKINKSQTKNPEKIKPVSSSVRKKNRKSKCTLV
ncbi:unnamed protein product [Phytomonas sp. EM1]|nr:unnamed protein product [Phytomonas sp. EM1]|eukprot:CCW63251.1 unnamed protein product [Phytomonas sp. isolate EM1]